MVEGATLMETGKGKTGMEEREKVLFSPPKEKLFNQEARPKCRGLELIRALHNPMNRTASAEDVGFNDADLDEPLAFVGAGETCLRETEINGVKCFKGEVRFAGPNSYWSLLNPFTKAKDAEGNTYWVRGLVGLCIVIEAAKRKEKLKVVCLKTGEKEYEVVRW